MTDCWKDVSALFEAALARPPDDRASWLDDACGEDSTLRDEVERMLTAHERRDGVLDRPLPVGALDGEHEPANREMHGGRVGPYRLIHEVGRGGMGIVYKARDPRLERYVALKVLPPALADNEEATARFEAEARAVAAFDHPNICTMYDVGTVEGPTERLPGGLQHGQLFLAMAYYEGQTLDERMKRAPLPVEKSVSLARDVAEGLGRAHDAGIIHRDVKPSNLILTGQGKVKILDFGIAKLEQGAEWTDSGDRLGTVAYMAPEQLRGDAVQPQTDLWALGVVLYELLTGEHPFGDGPETALSQAILHDDPPAVGALRPECPDPLEEVVRTTLAKDPEERYASASDLIADLESVRRRSGDRSSSVVLPAPLTSFVGRGDEVEDIRQQLSRSRLVTLTGPAGTGKTRLAVQVAARMREDMNDGVFFVPLAPVRDPDLVASAIAQALDLDERPAQPIAERLTTVLQDQEVLLVLDNFEQVISAAPLVTDLLSACSGLRVLVTSRKALRVSGEQEFPVPPLDVPPSEIDPRSEALSDYSAVALFVERAGAVRPDFTITDANARPVAELCRRLEGLPLAIELAAARIKLFSPQEMLDRLGERLDLLTGGPRDRPARHQTLRQAIAWSYDLLDRQEQAFFRRMAVFVDGCTLEAAEAVTTAHEPIQRDVVDAVEGLVDRNLLRREDGPDGRSRYVMLEMIRAFGLEQLEDHREVETTREAHANYFLSLAETAKPNLTGPTQGEWLDRLEAEHDNFRAALSWAEEEGRAQMGLRLGAALWRFWVVRDRLREGCQRLERLLEHPEAQSPTPARASALNAAGTLLHELSDFHEARGRLEESLSICRETGDRQGMATALNNLGWVASQTGNFDSAEARSKEALSLCRDLGATRDVSLSLNNLGWVAMFRGEFDRARALYQDSLDLRREGKDKRGSAFALTNLGWAECYRGNYARASDLLQEALEILERLDDNQLIAWNYDVRALVSNAVGDLVHAAAAATESVGLWREVGNKEGLAHALCTLARVRIDQGDLESATNLIEEAVPIIREVDDRWDFALALRIRGRIAHKKQEASRAMGWYRKSLKTSAEIGAKWGVATCLEAIASVCRPDDPERSVRLLAAAETLRAKLNAPRPAHIQNKHERDVGLLRQELGEETFQDAWEEGKTLETGDAVALALGGDG